MDEKVWNLLELGDSTFEYMVDDHCIRIRAKVDDPGPGMWIPKELCSWLGEQGSNIIDPHQ